MNDTAGRTVPGAPHGGERMGSGAMFDGIAPRYDLLNRLMSLGIDRRWRKRTVAALAPALELPAALHGDGGDPGPPRVLDLATGTADVALAIARRYLEVHVVGVDPSPGMLAVGRQKVTRGGLDDRVELAPGDAQALDFADDSFAATTIAFGIRNVPDRARALAEMARVTRAGGRIAILELSEPERGVMAGLARFHMRVLVPHMGGLLSGSREYRYLQASIAAFPPVDEFARTMEEAGIEVLQVERFTFGVCHLYLGTPAGEGHR